MGGGGSDDVYCFSFGVFVLTLFSQFHYISSPLCSTLMIQFRHQCELGGAYWSANVVFNQAFCFVAVFLYDKYSEDASEEVVEFLWMIVGGLFIFSTINFSLFLKMINREYIHTFFSTTTGKEFSVQNYEESETDAVKFELFGHHRSYYDSIQEDIMKWLQENWDKWEESNLDWFTPNSISNVPADMLPVSVLQRMGGERGRKASIAQMKKEQANGGKIVRGADLKVIPN